MEGGGGEEKGMHIQRLNPGDDSTKMDVKVNEPINRNTHGNTDERVGLRQTEMHGEGESVNL